MAKQGVALLAEDLQNRYNSIEAIGLTKVDYTPIEVGQYEPQPYDTVGTSCTPSPSPTIAPHPSTSRLAPVDCMIVSQVDLNKVIKRLRIVGTMVRLMEKRVQPLVDKRLKEKS